MIKINKGLIKKFDDLRNKWIHMGKTVNDDNGKKYMKIFNNDCDKLDYEYSIFFKRISYNDKSIIRNTLKASISGLNDYLKIFKNHVYKGYGNVFTGLKKRINDNIRDDFACALGAFKNHDYGEYYDINNDGLCVDNYDDDTDMMYDDAEKPLEITELLAVLLEHKSFGSLYDRLVKELEHLVKTDNEGLGCVES